jgi:hypothetical protein
MRDRCECCGEHKDELFKHFLDADEDGNADLIEDQEPWCKACYEEQGWRWYPGYGAYTLWYDGPDIDQVIEV